jgi:Raf kinase inhibitor-like YbhB/YbcL family protein
MLRRMRALPDDPRARPAALRAALLAMTLVAAVVAACSGSAAATASLSAEETDMAGFELSSPSFVAGGAIPTKHSCDGSDVSPALVWQGAPASTAALALIVDDPDARGFIHWVVYNISGSPTGGLPEGAGSASNPPQGRNDFGRVGWGGPCPPGGTHHYRFTLYALSAQLPLSGMPTATEVRNALGRVLLGQTTLTATYTRQK